MTKKRVFNRIEESEFDKLNKLIFDIESKFFEGHDVRRELYVARIAVNCAKYKNRENTDYYQTESEEIES